MIGRECKYSNVLSGPILICRGLDLSEALIVTSASEVRIRGRRTLDRKSDLMGAFSMKVNRRKEVKTHSKLKVCTLLYSFEGLKPSAALSNECKR